MTASHNSEGLAWVRLGPSAGGQSHEKRPSLTHSISVRQISGATRQPAVTIQHRPSDHFHKLIAQDRCGIASRQQGSSRHRS
jgi:hypothetical protein